MTRKRQICGVSTEAIPTDALHWAARYFTKHSLNKTQYASDELVFPILVCKITGKWHSCISPWQYNHVIQRLWTL